MRSVSADFWASAGAAAASVMQAASSAPRSQVSDRISLVLSISNRIMPGADGSGNRQRGKQTTPERQATRMPTRWPRAGAAPDLSVTDGRQQPFQETVDSLSIDAANNGHEIVLRIDINHVGAVADVGECGYRCTRPALPVRVKKPV